MYTTQKVTFVFTGVTYKNYRQRVGLPCQKESRGYFNFADMHTKIMNKVCYIGEVET